MNNKRTECGGMKVVSGIVIVFGLIALGAACYFMCSMVDILKRGNGMRDTSSTTNTVCRSAAMLNVSGVGNKVESGDQAIVAAYESLSNELSSWMAIMGLFATVFGLVIPIGSYLLQQQSLSREKKELKDDVKDKIKELKEEMDKSSARNRDAHQKRIKETEEKISAGLIHRMQPMWNFLASNFDRFLIDDAKKIEEAVKSGTIVVAGNIAPSDDNVSLSDIANFLIGFDIYLDCLVRAENAGVIIAAIGKYQRVIDAVCDNSDIWPKVVAVLRIVIQKNPDFVSGSEFERLIGADREKYAWLKSLYDEIIPWKFS